MPSPPANRDRELAPALRRWREAFTELRAESQIPVDALYEPDALFEDPLRRLRGREEIAGHFARLNAHLLACRFEHERPLVDGDEAALPWRMSLELRRGPGRTIVVPGVSLLRFGERVSHQRDLFDAGALVYEQVPLVGAAIRFIKRRL